MFNFICSKFYLSSISFFFLFSSNSFFFSKTLSIYAWILKSFESIIAKDFSKASPIAVFDYFLFTGLSAMASKKSFPFKVCLLDIATFCPGYGTGSKPPNPAAFASESESVWKDVPPWDF